MRLWQYSTCTLWKLLQSNKFVGVSQYDYLSRHHICADLSTSNCKLVILRSLPDFTLSYGSLAVMILVNHRSNLSLNGLVRGLTLLSDSVWSTKAIIAVSVHQPDFTDNDWEFPKL